MKLRDVVIQGRCCGLETVEECVTNFFLHSMQMFPYNALEYETKELNNEIKSYEDGILELDWEYINAEVAQFEKDYDSWLQMQLSDPTEDEETFWKLENMK